MITILSRLYTSLEQTFESKLNRKEKRYFENKTIDVLSTFLTLNKTEIAFREIIESSGIPKEILVYEFEKEKLDLCLSNEYVKFGSGINDGKIFIVSNGLYYYYCANNLNVNSVFVEYDNFRLPQKILKLKSQEKILCIFLILVGADNENSKFDSSVLGNEILDKYFSFFQKIESELENFNIKIGPKIKWGQGKDRNFRLFITNNVLLPHTNIYKQNNAKYYLDLSKKRNIKIIIDLILDEYKDDQKIMIKEVFFNCLYQLSGLMPISIGIIPPDLNNFLQIELRG